MLPGARRGPQPGPEVAARSWNARDRNEPAPSLFVEDGVTTPLGKGNLPSDLRDRHLITITCSASWPTPRRLSAQQIPADIDRFDRMTVRKTIALHRPSVFLLLRGTISLWRDATGGESSIFCAKSLALRGEFWQGRRLGQYCCPNGFHGGIAGHGLGQLTTRSVMRPGIQGRERPSTGRTRPSSREWLEEHRGAKAGAAELKECADGRRRPQARIDR
jgi:hypothetical protein